MNILRIGNSANIMYHILVANSFLSHSSYHSNLNVLVVSTNFAFNAQKIANYNEFYCLIATTVAFIFNWNMKTNGSKVAIHVPLQFIKNTIGWFMFKISDEGIYFSIIGDRAIIIEIKMTEQYNVQILWTIISRDN